MKTRPLLIIIVVQCVLCVALVLTLCLAIGEAERAGAISDESYGIGYRDGGVRVIIELERARITREIIADQQAATRKSGSAALTDAGGKPVARE